MAERVENRVLEMTAHCKNSCIKCVTFRKIYNLWYLTTIAFLIIYVLNISKPEGASVFRASTALSLLLSHGAKTGNML